MQHTVQQKQLSQDDHVNADIQGYFGKPCWHINMPMRLVLSFIAPRMQRFNVTSQQQIVRTTDGSCTHECIKQIKGKTSPVFLDTFAQHPVYQQVFHFMGFAVGSLVGNPLEAAHTFRI